MKPNSNIETTVGIFLLVGIGVICSLILFFGEVKDMFHPTYRLSVQFPNASGLLKGSDVYLSGAAIGKVISNPQPIPDTQLVQVELKIDNKVRLRNDARYVIGSSGLLGDRFVDVQPFPYSPGTPEESKKPFVEDGAVIQGAQINDFNAVLDSSKPLIDRANHIAAQLDDMITRLNTDVLPATSTDDLKETIAKLRDMVDNGDSMMKNANELLVQAKSGKGALGKLLNDRQTAENLSSFIANLKAHGPVFYKDDSDDKNRDGKKK